MRRWILFGALAAAGCVSFPDETKIEDLRVLEIRLEPPEVPVFAHGQRIRTVEDLRTATPTSAAVQVRALVAHPDPLATLGYDWGRCSPGFDDFPCDNGPRVRLVESSTPGFSFEPISVLLEEALASGDPQQGLAALANDPRELLNGLQAEVMLRASVERASIPVDSTAIDAKKRLVIFDPALVRLAILQARQLAAGMPIPTIPGVSLPNLCTTVSEAQVQRVFTFLDQRQPNRAPLYLRLEMARRSADGGESPFQPVAPGEVITLAPGDELSLRGAAREQDLEDYTIIDDNCQLQDLQETMVWSWFTDRGEVSRALTTQGKADLGADERRVIYTAPPAGALTVDRTPARVYSVLRDGRGGSDARILELSIEKGAL